MDLKQENKQLKKQLLSAKKWMQQEVLSAEKNISYHSSQKETHSLYHENLESIIEDRIYSFFPPEVLSQFPADGVANIISSEVIYHHIVAGGHVDGTGVVIGYQKVLDGMIELYITKGFRKYVKKNFQISTPKNIPLEKSLYQVIEKKYILSLGRLYEILKKIQKQDTLTPYLQYFESYLKSRDFLYKALLESDFLIQLETLIRLHAIGEKRHSGSISKKDTVISRNACVGNFENTNCLLYILASLRKVDI